MVEGAMRKAKNAEKPAEPLAGEAAGLINK